MDAHHKRNFVLLGHAHAGKTTLSESILYFSKTTPRKGVVSEGTTVSDYSFDEIARKNSINTSILYCNHKNTRIQFIDTPGYADFFGEIISSLRAVDSAIIVVDATAGVEVGTERAWQLLEKYLEGTQLSTDELKVALRQAVIKRKLFPVLSGSAFADKGIAELLDMVVEYLPSPLERPIIEARDPLKAAQKKEGVPQEAGPV